MISLKDLELENTISDIILEVANLYNDVTTSDLQGIAQVKAKEILNLIEQNNLKKETELSFIDKLEQDKPMFR